MLRVIWLCLSVALDYIWLGVVRRVAGPAAARRREPLVHARVGARIRRTAVHLGGLIVKVGQFLSTRADLLPEVFTHELTELQDVVPAVAWPVIAARLEAAYGRPAEQVFATIETTPLAAASLAQVYAAVLPDGRSVAVKVLRPGIDALVDADLRALRIAAVAAHRWSTWGRRFDLIAVHAEIDAVSREELDLFGEAERAARFARNFADTRWVAAPEIHAEWSRPGVLVMERINGLRIDDLAALSVAGIDPRQLGRRLLRSSMKQFLEDGFYHADPHPGNLFVRPDGTVVYIDFGMMGQVGPEDRVHLRRLVLGLFKRDVDEVLEATFALGFVRSGTERAPLRRALAFAVDQVLGVSKVVPGTPAFAQFAAEMRDFLYAHPFQLQARYTMLGRAIGILAGIVERLCPEDNFFLLLVEAALRFLHSDATVSILAGLAGDAARGGRTGGDGSGRGADKAGRSDGPWRALWEAAEPLVRDALDAIGPEVLQTVQDTVLAPSRSEHLLSALARGDWQVPLDWGPLGRDLQRHAERLRAFGWAVWGGSSIVAGAWLRAAHMNGFAWVAWSIGAVCFLAFIRPRR